MHITCRVADTPPRSDGFKVPFPVEKKVIIPKMEEVAEPDQISDSGEDELTPLKRSNSVRNRIQVNVLSYCMTSFQVLKFKISNLILNIIYFPPGFRGSEPTCKYWNVGQGSIAPS